MKKIIAVSLAVIIAASVAVVLFLVCNKEAEICVMSYNLLADNGEGGYDWGTPLEGRYEGAIKCLRKYAPDVAGLQETTNNWYAKIRENLPNYKFVNSVDPDNGNEDGICTALMYNPDTVELLESELIPFRSNYWGVGRVRYINMGYFRHRETGIRFIAISTHFDAGQEEDFAACRVDQAKQLAETLNGYIEKYSCPIISVGDYNCGCESEPYNYVLSNTDMVSMNTKPKPETIDHILCTNDVERVSFSIIKSDYVKHASDHLPLRANIKIR